ncbi:hypothetical protein Efla_004902 [Eimeria flavescens]
MGGYRGFNPECELDEVAQFSSCVTSSFAAANGQPLKQRRARAKGAKAQVENLSTHMEEGRQLLVEARGEAEEGHRWRDQVTEASSEVSSLTAELRAMELPSSQLHGTNRLIEAEFETLNRQQQHWLQERSQHEETTHRLLAAEARGARMPILEQQVDELKGHKEALGQAQMNEAKARSEAAHLEPGVREATISRRTTEVKGKGFSEGKRLTDARELPLSSKEPHRKSNTPHDDAGRQHSASGVSTDGLECLESHSKPREKRIGTKWVVAVCVVGLLLMLFRCHLAFPRSLMSGLQHRGLGESGSDDNNDEKEPLSPEFQELCLEVGHWSPSPPPSEGPCGSPSMLKPFLENLVQEQEFALDEKAQNQSWRGRETVIPWNRRPTGHVPLPSCDTWDGGEDRKGHTINLSGPQSFCNTIIPSWFCGAGAEAATTQSALAGPSSPRVSITASASSSVVPALSSLPPAAASQSPSGQGSEVDTAGNSFLRLPTLTAGVKPKPFRAIMLQKAGVPTTLPEGVSDTDIIATGRDM